MSYKRRDAKLVVDGEWAAHQASGTNTTTTDSIKIREDYVNNAFLADVEVAIAAPEFEGSTSTPASKLVDGETLSYNIQSSDDDSSWDTILEGVVVQTGNTGNAADAETKTAKLPNDVGKYIRLAVVGHHANNRTTDVAKPKMEIAF